MERWLIDIKKGRGLNDFATVVRLCYMKLPSFLPTAFVEDGPSVDSKADWIQSTLWAVESRVGESSMMMFEKANLSASSTLKPVGPESRVD